MKRLRTKSNGTSFLTMAILGQGLVLAPQIGLTRFVLRSFRSLSPLA